MRYLILLLISVGCSPAFNSTNTFSADKEYDNEDDEFNDFFSQAGLPDLRERMEPDYCDDAQPNAAGAAGYFLGTYVQEGEGWIGKERWYLFPTPTWVEVEDDITEEGCYVTWEMEASETDCIDCDLGLAVTAGVNRNETNCPEGLWDNPEEEQWEASYNIDIDGDTSAFYFQGSGTFIGNGYSSATAVSFLSDVSCSWF